MNFVLLFILFQLVLNGFSTDNLPMKLMTTMFQNLFPSINIQKVKSSLVYLQH